MSAILYYITGHGYGHAVRSLQVIQALAAARPALRIHVRTTAPHWLFENTTDGLAYSRQSIDVGIIQRDSLRMELAETLNACRELHDRLPEIVNRELEFISNNHIRLIIGDTPPLCFEIAARAAISSVSITNFTWDFIYRAYVQEHNGFAPLIDQMTAFYEKTSLALTLPYPCDTRMFRRQEAISWVSRTSLLTRSEARQRFDLPSSATIVLLSFGGLGLDRLPWKTLKQQADYFFITTGDRQYSDGNVLVLQNTIRHYEDLVRAVDAVVTKPGYGIVADVLAHRLPILFTDRGQFPEYPRLVEALHDCATSEFIAQDELLAGNLTPYLNRLLTKPPNWPKVELNGAQMAAARTLTLLDEST